MLAMPSLRSNRLALDQLRARGFAGVVTAVATFDDEAQELRELGLGSVLQIYDGAGVALADMAADDAGRGGL